MHKFHVHFDYKNERRRSWIYFLTPSIIGLILKSATIIVLDHPHSLKEFLVDELYPYGLQTFIWTRILTAFIDFLRNLNDRFEASNTLLRFAAFLLWFSYLMESLFFLLCFHHFFIILEIDF